MSSIPPVASNGAVSAYGRLSHQRRDQLYVLPHGFVYSSPWVVTAATSRPAGVVLLTVDGSTFTVEVEGKRCSHNAFAIGPNVCRGLSARGVGLVSLNVAPAAPMFPGFRALSPLGVEPLDHSAFHPHAADLAAFSSGTPLARAPSQAFDDIVATALAQLAPPPIDDPRRSGMLDAVVGARHDSLALERISQHLGLSYHRASHVFSSALGIPLRSYLAWEKQRRLLKPLLIGKDSLTCVAHDCGLPDSAYLSRIYQRWYGQKPSFARSQAVHVHLGSESHRS